MSKIQINARIEPELNEKLLKAMKKSKRTKTQEVIMALEKHLKNEK